MTCFVFDELFASAKAGGADIHAISRLTDRIGARRLSPFLGIGTGTGMGLTFKTHDPCTRAGISCDFVYRAWSCSTSHSFSLKLLLLVLLEFIYHHRPCGSCRGPVLVTLRLKHLRSLALNLDEAIALHREALTLLPVGHTDRSGSLNSLAAPLSSRFCR
ncbi:uncharacterized protein F5891DRAFT_25933 [Suillus fuscotomentosus]|uniref:Uncharacterized protein n=1 Tax=Suillus fuscotomentosus TaxID=1912939 RepID=A0AAD4HWG0_9AGAM|nr:uncharacterized protein F5891DRAFT_25933 [Suillus fuscotomentosus]KAG1908744.1 hypothetical protein F5891DRAFT_25933 [Suillus fuscotomentosus]